jgi:hypothetical protein
MSGGLRKLWAFSFRLQAFFRSFAARFQKSESRQENGNQKIIP